MQRKQNIAERRRNTFQRKMNNETRKQKSMQIKDKTAMFQEYLGDTFNSGIKEDIQIYFIVDKLACSECVRKMFEIIDNDLKVDKSNITFIISNPNFFDHNLKNKYNFLIDKKGKIDNLNLELQNVSVFETSQKEIKKVHFFNTDQISEFEVFIKGIYIK